jgi:CheY-like chemotaxis protein
VLLNGSGQGLRPCLSLGLCLEFGDYNCTEINAETQQQAAILLVDDNAINLQLLFETLDGQGYLLLAARSGEEALRIAPKAIPDLILPEIMMPGIDGYETCARLKSDEVTCSSVVIFLSALQSTEEKARGLSIGAMDFITKPYVFIPVILPLFEQRRFRQLPKSIRNFRSWALKFYP